MTTLEAIKNVVKNYMDNEALSNLVYATYTGAGLKIEGKPQDVTMDMVDIPMHMQTITGLLSCDLTANFEIVAKDGQGKDVIFESIKLIDAPVTIKTGIAPGTRVAVVQQKGANKYSIVDEVTG